MWHHSSALSDIGRRVIALSDTWARGVRHIFTLMPEALHSGQPAQVTHAIETRDPLIKTGRRFSRKSQGSISQGDASVPRTAVISAFPTHPAPVPGLAAVTRGCDAAGHPLMMGLIMMYIIHLLMALLLAGIQGAW